MPETRVSRMLARTRSLTDCDVARLRLTIRCLVSGDDEICLANCCSGEDCLENDMISARVRNSYNKYFIRAERINYLHTMRTVGQH